MYTQTWNKYLPVLRILIKRSINEDQTLQLNISDFQRSGTFRKTGPTFTIGVGKTKGRNIAGQPEIGKNLASVLMSDKAIKETMSKFDFDINMDTKYKLHLKMVSGPVEETEAPALEAIAE